MANDPQINDNVNPDVTRPDSTAGAKQPGRAGGKHTGRKNDEYFDYHDAMIQIEMIFLEGQGRLLGHRRDAAGAQY